VSCVGGNAVRAAAASAVVGAGIAVMGHTGLMPQSVSVLGGFRPQGRTADSALLVIQDAIVYPPPLTPPSHTPHQSPIYLYPTPSH
jgi:ketopantoate hydroxymethyltransferase